MMKRILTAGAAGVTAIVLMAPAVIAGPPEAPEFTHGVDGDDVHLTNGNNSWTLDADTGTAVHENLKSGKTNEISVGEFIDVFYDQTGKEPGEARLTALVECETSGTWRSSFVKGAVVKYIAWSDGVAVSLDAPSGAFEERVEQQGEAAFVLQGRLYANDTALVGGRITGEDPGAFTSDTNGETPVEYDISWDDTGTPPSGGADWVNNKLTTPIASGDGHGIGRCGTTYYPNLDVQQSQSLIWYTGQFVRDDV